MPIIKRRDFVRGHTAVVPGSVAVGALTNKFAWTQAADFKSDVDVLNYALTLEYLEAEFYRQGNGAGLVSGKEAKYLRQVQVDEESHVATIRSTIMDLGGSPVAAPGVDFGESFADRESFLTTAHVFENTGVSAYLGAAGYIKDKGILQAAAGIFGVEARHAAILGNLLDLEAEGGVYMGAVETPKTKAQILEAVTPFLAGAGSMKGDAAVTL
jgi:rubrerythrin